MQKALQYLIILTCLFQFACHHAKTTNPVSTLKKPDLQKAALFNVQLGMGYLNQNDRPRAKKKLLLALQQKPDSADVNAAIAYFYEQTHELDKAKNYYLRSITLSNQGGAQLNNYGTFLCKQGEYKRAEAYFIKAAADENYIHTAGAYENAGLCAQAIPDLNKAKQYFNTALEQDPTRTVSLYELAKIVAHQGNAKQALALIQNKPELVLKDPIFLALAKEIAEKAGRLDLAVEYDNYTKKITPRNTSGV